MLLLVVPRTYEGYVYPIDKLSFNNNNNNNNNNINNNYALAQQSTEGQGLAFDH